MQSSRTPVPKSEDGQNQLSARHIRLSTVTGEASDLAPERNQPILNSNFDSARCLQHTLGGRTGGGKSIAAALFGHRFTLLVTGDEHWTELEPAQAAWYVSGEHDRRRALFYHLGAFSTFSGGNVAGYNVI